MSFRRRPSPDTIAARLREINRRYARKAKVGKRTLSMAAIRLAELQRWLDHTSGAGLEPDAHGEMLARIFVHHLVVLTEGNRRAAQWLDRYAPWITLRSREAMITEANYCPLKWTARKLGWKLRLSDTVRTELKITTIAPFDVTDCQLKARRKAKQAELQRARRARLKAERQQHIG